MLIMDRTKEAVGSRVDRREVTRRQQEDSKSAEENYMQRGEIRGVLRQPPLTVSAAMFITQCYRAEENSFRIHLDLLLLFFIIIIIIRTHGTDPVIVSQKPLHTSKIT